MALEKKDPLCTKVVDYFLKTYGAEAGDLALKTMPNGGIYLIGNLTNGLREQLLS